MPTVTQGTVTPAGVVNFNPNTGERLATGQSATVEPGGNTYGSTPTPSPSLIVTSAASRSNYAGNVQSNGEANASIPVPSYGSTFYNPNTGKADGTNKFDPNTGKPLQAPSALAASGATGGGNTQPGTGPVQNGSGVKSSSTNGDGSQTVIHNDGTIAIVPAAPAADGSGTGGTGNKATAAAADYIDPAVSSAFSSNISALTQQANDASAAVAQAAATLQNDPAALAAAASITSQYQQLIQAQIARNNILLGSYKANAARGGSLQFANNMESNFMSEEMISASNAVSDLVTRQNAALIQSNTAFKNGDVKAFNDATVAYNDIAAKKTQAILDLANATDKAVKDAQAATRQASLDAQNAIKDAQTEKHQDLQDALASATLSQKMKQDAIDNAFKAQQISETQRHDYQTELNAQNSSNAANSNAAFTNINLLLGKDASGLPIRDVTTGIPYTDAAGNFTAQGFKTLVETSKDDGVSRADIIAQYPHRFVKGAGAAYGLTPKEIESLGL